MTKTCITLVTAALLLLLGAVSTQAQDDQHNLITIDGHNVTIAIATSLEMTDEQVDITLAFADLILSIFKALNEPEFDYWGNVQDEVEAMVGGYINQHNINQVVAFQGDLETLLLRYLEAPAQSNNYPTKNEQASALSMAIISHRYLVMSGDLRFSLELHYEDIASMHLVVLMDAAETYSTESSPSQWWVDLDDELELYLNYSVTVTQELHDWRLGMVTCTEKLNVNGRGASENKKTTYDIYRAVDEVTAEVSECKQIHGASDCVNHCQVFSEYREQEVQAFVAAKVTSVTNEWEELKKISSVNAGKASRFYDPARGI